MFVLSPVNTAFVLFGSVLCYFLVIVYQKRRMMNGLVCSSRLILPEFFPFRVLTQSPSLNRPCPGRS
jgi:hypothetical protein